MAWIYKIVKISMDVCYVGHTSGLPGRRWKSHRDALRKGSHPSRHLQRSWSKYGEEAFRFEVIEECSEDQKIEREQFYIDTLNSRYNLAKAAGSRKGVRFTLEQRRKLSEGLLGHVISEETKLKIADSNRGKHDFTHTPESKAKIGDASKDWWATHEPTPAQRATFAENARKGLGSPNNPANKPGWVPAHRIGMKDTEETKARRSASKRATQEARREQGLQHIWITDGVQECQILNTAPLPTAWYQGRQSKIGEVARSRVGETRTEDARKHMASSARNAWSDSAKRQAMMRNRRPFCWITNGVVSRRLHDDEEMPEGFQFGRRTTSKVEETVE